MDASATAPSPSHAQTPAHVARAPLDSRVTSYSRHTPRCLQSRAGSTSRILALQRTRFVRSCFVSSTAAREAFAALVLYFVFVPVFSGGPRGAFRGTVHASRARFLTPSRNRHAVLSYPPGKPTRSVAVGRHTRLCTIRPSVLSVIPSARLNAWPGKAAHRRPAPCWNSPTARRARNRGRSCASRYGRS